MLYFCHRCCFKSLPLCQFRTFCQQRRDNDLVVCGESFVWKSLFCLSAKALCSTRNVLLFQFKGTFLERNGTFARMQRLFSRWNDSIVLLQSIFSGPESDKMSENQPFSYWKSTFARVQKYHSAREKYLCTRAKIVFRSRKVSLHVYKDSIPLEKSVFVRVQK